MAEQTLEFRGIPLQHLMDYLKELKAAPVHAGDFPLVFAGTGWSASILKEEEVTITSTFKVNAVHIRFQADSNPTLDTVIVSFRKKTFRAGG